jgi:SAM-dependent methyltransferase
MRWSTPPPTEATLVTRSIYDTGTRPPRFSVDLLESLNEEYATKKLVAAPPSYQSDAKYQVALGRVKWTHGHVDLRDKTVLEIGCGDGYGTWILGTDLGCDSFGVDVQQRASWASLEGDTVHFACADISQDQIYEPETFDRIVSYTVWEHVVHPFAMLQETYRLLKPGGLAWIRANLYAGPMASHRYRDINFPWPHLLFSDDVIRDWDTKHGRPAKGSSWVNRLSWLHYERSITDLGFGVRHLHFQNAKWDEEFYQRFEDILGRFPKADLERDFFLVVLEKPA